MRLFTAIELPEAVRAAVHAAAAPHLRGVAGCKATPPQNLHVTVAFLGEVPPERLPGIAEALRKAAASSPRMRLRVAGYGAFPHLRRPRVIWAGLDDPERGAAALERAVTAALEPLGFPPEERDWTPHVTIARLADTRKFGPRARPWVQPPDPPPGPWFEAAELVLFESVLGPRGAEHRPLERFPLGPPEHRPPPPR